MTGLIFAAALAALPAGMSAAVAPALSQSPPVERRAAPAPTRAGVIGVVRGVDGVGGGPLPFAMVEVVDSGGPSAVLANAEGRYALSGLEPGLWRVRASHVGYESTLVEVLVPRRGTVSVDLALRARPVELPPLRVGADPLRIPLPSDRILADSERARELVELRALEASPGLVEAGVGAVAGNEGGDPPDPSTVLYMRGSTADLKLVLLDGAPVYTPFHLGGLLPSFEPGVLGTATHHVGGAPARYDGGLSYILDLRTRPARREGVHGSGTVDLMSFQGNVEGPVSMGAGREMGVLAAARTLHGMAGLIAGGDGSPYGYTDGIVRADLAAGESGHLSFMAFANRESVRLALGGVGGAPGLDRARWGNDALSGTFRGRAGGVHVDVGGALSRYDAELPVQAARAPEGTGTPDPAALPVIASGRTERARLTVDATTRVASGSVRFGGSFDGMRVRYGSRALETTAYLE
ncbi:MAG TPA: carboxypeptidase-like regulatory domain-containing protein, partial [Longimicrobiales bacterium]